MNAVRTGERGKLGHNELCPYRGKSMTCNKNINFFHYFIDIDKARTRMLKMKEGFLWK